MDIFATLRYHLEHALHSFPLASFPTRFYGDDASSTNGGYRAVGYVIELRDTGVKGFLLPPDQVRDSMKQVYHSVHKTRGPLYVTRTNF